MIKYLIDSEARSELAEKANKTQEDWIEPTLINGWAEYNPSILGNVAYRRNETGFLEFKGALQSGSSGTVAFIITEGRRPVSAGYFASSSGGSSNSKTIVRSNGEVQIDAYTTVAYLHGVTVSLD
jgi:hypothetical protein